MSYVLLTRMFSGLYETIRTGVWRPTGIPAIVHLAEHLVRSAPVHWCVVAKTAEESAVVAHRPRVLHFPNGVTMFVIPRRPFTGIVRIDAMLHAVPVALRSLAYAVRLGDAVCYCDRSHIVIAAFLKIIFRRSVVIRVLGMYPDQKALVESRWARFRAPLTTFAYRVRYDLAICSQDGSGSEYYFERLLHATSNRWVLVNGVGVRAPARALPRSSGPLRLLFVGTLTPTKGVVEFIEALGQLRAQGHVFSASIVGKGPLEAFVRERVRILAINDVVEIVPRVPLDEIAASYARADIYVSLNVLGNLSNTVLEAMAAGKCIVMLGPEPETHTDEATARLVPRDVVVRINRTRVIEHLVAELGTLLAHPEYIRDYEERMRLFSGQFLWSWNERVDYERRLLEQIKARESSNRAGALSCNAGSERR
ncbi:MAG: glycosyltransferase [bacterium]|nr:glycosyltransferase [bacterium]